MDEKDIVFDGHHTFAGMHDGHPWVHCESHLGNDTAEDGNYPLHYDEQREVWWCDNCSTSFEEYVPMGASGPMPGGLAEIAIPVKDEKTGKIIRVRI